MPNERLISISEAARRIGIHKSTLSRQISTGLIRSHDGRVLLSEVEADRRRNLDPARRRRPAKPQEGGAFQAIELGKSEFHAGTIAGALGIMYRAPAIAALLAIDEAGVSIEQAHALHRCMIVAAIELAEAACNIEDGSLRVQSSAFLIPQFPDDPAQQAEWDALTAKLG